MAVEITRRTTLKPSPSTPPHPFSGTRVPLTVFDRAALNLHVPTVFAFHAPTPTNDELKRGLSEALAHFPHLAGRNDVDERERPCILINNAGIRVIETRVSASLLEMMPLEETTKHDELYPPADDAAELLLIQLNRYTCGGLVIGASSHHYVADGHSMNNFFAAWAAMVRGDCVVPTPYLDRAAAAEPRDPPSPEFEHQDIEFKVRSVHPVGSPLEASPSKIENLTVHFSTEFIAELKASVPGRCSTFQCILAHMWKKITAARGVDADELTQVRVAVDCRGRARPAVPQEFFGNMVLWAFPKVRAGELLQGSHATVVKVIQEAVARVDDSYIRSFADYGKVAEERGDELAAATAEAGSALCPDLEVDSWVGFSFHDLDFGGGSPCAFFPPDLPIEGLMVFVPAGKKGGIDVFVALLDDHVGTFKQICYSLD